MIEARALSKRYGATEAVRNLTATVGPGEIVGLLGRNGAGKTTTLHLLTGIQRPDSGTVQIAGVDLAREPVRAKAVIGYVPDEPTLFEYLTVVEHLEFVARMYAVADASDRINMWLRRCELEERAHDFPEALSRGMRQRLAVACALLHDPKALLLDEPLTGLDPAGMRATKDLLIACARAGMCVLLSSHQLSLVEELCSRVVVLSRGNVVFDGTITALRAAGPDGESAPLEDVFLALTDHAA